MIYTLTMNPAIDYYMGFGEEISLHQKTKDIVFLPGGKGINASKVINELGGKCQTIALTGGIFGKKFLKIAKDHNINIKNINVENETRINVKSNFKNITYEQNSMGSKINSFYTNKKIIKILKSINQEDIVMIMGSLPIGYSWKDLKTLIEYIKNKNAKLVFDIPGRQILTILKFEPELIKPNKKELEVILNSRINNKDDIAKGAKILLEKGAKRVIVSLDKNGSYYFDKNKSFFIKSPTIKEINGSGAGDSMIATFTYFLNKKNNMKEILKVATAAGAATAASKWIAKKESIEKLINKVLIREV